jgi:hypothetical protein
MKPIRSASAIIGLAAAVALSSLAVRSQSADKANAAAFATFWDARSPAEAARGVDAVLSTARGL